MIAIAVDDEVLMLGALVAAIKASPDISEVSQFSGCDEALAFVKENSVDVAFLDINMRGMGGLALAEKIGSVNTIIRRSDGTLYGDNTDYFGFLYMAKKCGCDFNGKKVKIVEIK